MSTELATEWATPEVDPLQVAAPHIGSDIYFEHTTQFYYALDARGAWMRLNETNIKRRLKAAGIDCQPNDNPHITAVDAALLEIQNERRVDYAGPLAGYPKGVHEMEGKRVLVTDEAKPIVSVPGAWPMLKALIVGMLGCDPRQVLFLYGWLKIALENLRSEKRVSGQMLVMAGPVECGKSLMQMIITVLLGGRSSNPYGYMAGRSDFNAEMFGAEHLVIEDVVASTDLRSRRAFGAHLKELTVNESQHCHAKNKTALTLKPKWRVSVTVNDEPENLMVLPPIDRSLEDKMILLKAVKLPMPMSTVTAEDKSRFWDVLMAELPAFAAFLGEFEIPANMVSTRFGVTHFHHPEIVAALSSLSPEQRLLDLIDTEIFADANYSTSDRVWQGTALELQQQLTGSESCVWREASALFTFNTACGVYLARLALKQPTRVSKRTRNGMAVWQVDYVTLGGGVEGIS